MDERWAALVAGARAMMAERQPATHARYGLDYSMQYEWSTAAAQIVFSSQGVSVVRAGLQFVGSISPREGTWLWGWANESIPAAATRRLTAVREFGQERGFPKLTEPEWVPQGDDGHDVMLVAASILDAPAFFHDHMGSLALFFVLDGFERIGEEPACHGGPAGEQGVGRDGG